MNWLEFFIVLIFAHWVADFALQSNTMATRKNWKNTDADRIKWNEKYPNIPYISTWRYYLVAHGFIHGAIIYLFTGFIYIALIESFLHIIIDYIKTSGITNIHQDQWFHLACKLLYVWIFILSGGF